MNHPAARFQAVFFALWAGCWLVGIILPGGLGHLFLTLRDLVFLFLSALTVWLGYRLYYQRGSIVLFYMQAHADLARLVAGADAAKSVLRGYRKQAVMRQTGQTYLVVGLLCLAVGLYYFIF